MSETTNPPAPPKAKEKSYRLEGKGSVSFRFGQQSKLYQRGAVLTEAEYKAVPASRRKYFNEVEG